MNRPDTIRSGIIGVGFVGEVHARAVRAAGGVVAGVAASSPESAVAAAARVGTDWAARSAIELIESDDIDLVHICTPNAYHQPMVKHALKAGKPVICEKPLALSGSDAQELSDLAREAGVVTGVPFVYRFYPTVRDARARIASGQPGALKVLHGSYLQDWLSREQDSNWRTDSAIGGASRAFADIGVHWCDLMEFTTGHRITRVSARFLTTYPRRGSDAVTVVTTEDAATIQFDTDEGAIGSVVVSQVSPGRKNRLWFSFDGAEASLEFDQELPEHLWVGRRGLNEIAVRCPEGLAPSAARYSVLPAGHPQGYQECFNSFVQDVHARIRNEDIDGLPTFADGLRAARVADAVLNSAASESWTAVQT